VFDDIDNLRRGDGTRRWGKRERRIEEFKRRFGEGGSFTLIGLIAKCTYTT
jgi:hypothetical protein